jgi:hypothetical protein
LNLDKPPIPERDVKEFTKAAIMYFKDIDFSELHLHSSEKSGVFEALDRRYPVAWEALKHLGKWSNKAQRYDPIKMDPFYIPEINSPVSTLKGDKVEIQNGMDPKLDSVLIQTLMGISHTTNPFFFVDSFKMLTRNVEKLLRVMEYILRKDGMVVSSNFYISNGYVSKRKELLPPAHYTREVTEKFNNLNGLHKTHYMALTLIREQLLKK